MMKGKVSVSRVHSNHEDDYVSLELIDDLSHVTCVKIKMSTKTLGDVLTGMSRQECEFSIQPDLVGKVRETKSETVSKPTSSRSDENYEAELDTILKPFEIDGWEARREDFRNHYNSIGGDQTSITFIRFIEPD